MMNDELKVCIDAALAPVELRFCSITACLLTNYILSYYMIICVILYLCSNTYSGSTYLCLALIYGMVDRSICTTACRLPFNGSQWMLGSLVTVYLLAQASLLRP
jgi:hypothetical protein